LVQTAVRSPIATTSPHRYSSGDHPILPAFRPVAIMPMQYPVSPQTAAFSQQNGGWMAPGAISVPMQAMYPQMFVRPQQFPVMMNPAGTPIQLTPEQMQAWQMMMAARHAMAQQQHQPPPPKSPSANADTEVQENPPQ
jgi:hypothetical protein